MQNSLLLILIATRNRGYSKGATAIHLGNDDGNADTKGSNMEDMTADISEAISHSNDNHSVTERQSSFKKDS